MPELFQPLFDLLAMPAIKTALWGVPHRDRHRRRLAHRGAHPAQTAQRDGNPLPSSSILVNIARGVVWALGASVLLDACFSDQRQRAAVRRPRRAERYRLSPSGFRIRSPTLHRRLCRVAFMGRRPSYRGQYRWGPETGGVQDVTWHHTTIRDALGHVIIPNSIISKTALVHLLPANRVAVPLAVPRLGDDGGARTERRGRPRRAAFLTHLAGMRRAASPRHRRATRPVLRDLGTRHQGKDHPSGRGCRRRRAWRLTPWSVPSRRWCKRNQRSSISKRGQAPN